MKAKWGSGGINPRILDLSIGWRWVVSSIPRPLYPPPCLACLQPISLWNNLPLSIYI